MTAITITHDTPQGTLVSGGAGKGLVTFTAPIDLKRGDIVYVWQQRPQCVIRTMTQAEIVWEEGK